MAEASEIPDAAMSELQLCPPPPPDDLDRLLFHLPLEDFGRRLQRASQAVFPNDMKSRYTKVHVLLLCWEDGDPKLPVFRELMELENVFREDYCFETEVWKIPSKRSHHALNTKILEVVELEDDSRDCLKIVYYGGHGLLAPNRQLLWSNIPDKNDSGYRSIKWFAIQATLEGAEGDVLLLLDCCAAGTAATDNGHGVTELLGACAFNNTANGVGEFSFTNALCKELLAFRKVPSFTVGRLYNNLLRRIQLSPSHMTIQKAPVHVVLTQNYELPRSIQLSAMPRQLENAEDSKTLPPFESTSSLPKLESISLRLRPPTVDPMQTSSRGSWFSKVEEAEADSSSHERSDSSRTSISLDANTYPRIMLSVQLPGNVRPDQLSEDLFLEWLRMIPAVAECIKVEAGWVSLSTLIIVSVPMSIWKYIEGHQAIRLVGIIQSPNLLAPKQVERREVIASINALAGNTPQEKKGKGVEAIASTSAHDSGVIQAGGLSKDVVKKLDQIIQNFHTKAAVVVLQSRVSLPVVILKDGSKKVNKWFQIETDDTTDFREELNLWRTCGSFQNRPSPLIIETYLDTSNLTNSQSLVIVDDQGKRWDVLEALNSSGSSDGGSRLRRRNREVILERWRIELKDNPGERTYDLGSSLPTVYKKCIVFFRSLYAITKFVPTWRFIKNLAKSGSANNSLRVNCRILSSEVQPGRFNALTHPLYENGGPVTTDYFLGSIDTLAGQFCAEIVYRNDCNFRVDDSDALLSSRFIGADEHFFQPSLGIKGDNRRQSARTVEVGSSPTHRQQIEGSGPIQAYGSLSTFHSDVPLRGSSPISALRAAKTLGSEPNSPPTSSGPKARPIQTSRASLMSLEGITVARRPSVSSQRFKAGSLSSSPGRGTPLQHAGDMLPLHSSHSLPRTLGITALAQTKNRSPLAAGIPASLSGGPLVQENVVTSSASSSLKPTPINRYSNSFTHRRGRSSFGSASKIVDDDQHSSGKQSLSSPSAQSGSGILAEAGTGGSSGSLQTNDDNLSEFLTLVDSKLSEFQSMRESNNALTESMSSSTLLHRSSSSSSRQLSSIPPMVAATSMSVSSSPGKPVSPHTPHNPALPSRLSADSIAEYSEPRRLPHRNRAATDATLKDVADDNGRLNELDTNAIDIPTSPRPYYPHIRRSSSVPKQHRSLAIEDDLGDLPFGIHRSISLGADDREPPSLSALLGLGQTTENVASTSSTSPWLFQPAPHISESLTAMSRQASPSMEAHESEPQQLQRRLSAGSINSPYRPRLGRTGGRGVTPPQTGSTSSLVDRASGSRSERASGGHSFTRTAGIYEPDDEPLFFQMSEIGRGDTSRRSLEEPRGGGSTGPSERGGFDARRGGDSGSSSRRGSRRG